MKYSFDSRLRFSEADARGRLTPFSIMNYMQDAAVFHRMEGEKRASREADPMEAWIIASIRVKIHALPKVGSMIRTSTWATHFSSLLASREFSMDNENGDALVLARSEWLRMDLTTRQVVRIAKDAMDIYGLEPELEIKEDLGKRKVHIPKIEGEKKEPFRIQDFMIDTNGHVNNGQYVLLSRQLLPADLDISGMRLNFQKQAYRSDEVYPVVYPAENAYVTALFDKNGEAYFVGEYQIRGK